VNRCIDDPGNERSAGTSESLHIDHSSEQRIPCSDLPMIRESGAIIQQWDRRQKATSMHLSGVIMFCKRTMQRGAFCSIHVETRFAPHHVLHIVYSFSSEQRGNCSSCPPEGSRITCHHHRIRPTTCTFPETCRLTVTNSMTHSLSDRETVQNARFSSLCSWSHREFSAGTFTVDDLQGGSASLRRRLMPRGPLFVIYFMTLSQMRLIGSTISFLLFCTVPRFFDHIRDHRPD
jgi:hypothetical protein